jgi:hypothetical protein
MSWNFQPILGALGGPSDTVLTVQDGAHTHAADAPALMQAHTLAVSACDHAHGADSPALTQLHNLVVSESSHTHSIKTNYPANADEFSDDFDDNTFDAWTTTFGTVVAQNQRMEVTVDSSGGESNDYCSKTVTVRTEYYSSFRVYFSSITTFENFDTIWIGPLFNSRIGIEQLAGVKKWTIQYKDDAGNHQITTATNFGGTGIWYNCLVYGKSATAPGANNGIFKAWVNGVEIYSKTDIDSDTISESVGRFGNMYCTAGPVLSLYIDDCSIGTGLGSNDLWLIEQLGATELVVSECSHDQAADSPILTQVHTLVTQEASHIQPADSPSLTQVHTLAVQEASHAQNVDSPSLVQNYILAVSESFHIQGVDSPILSQQHNLSVSDGEHVQAADSPALNQAHNLQISEASHAHEGESPVLSQAHNLVVAEASHNHLADSPELTQAHTLIVSEATHAHSAEEPVLDVSSILEVSEASHSQAADSPSLTQVHFLAINDSEHTHVSDGITLSQIHQLLVDATEHGHTIDPVILSQAHQLAVSDGGHAHAADNIVLETTLPHVDLVVQEAIHFHISDAILLSQIHNLSVNEISHLFTSDGIDLAQLHLLSIGDTLHGHSADEPTLITWKESVDSKLWASKHRGPFRAKKTARNKPGEKRNVYSYFGGMR